MARSNSSSASASASFDDMNKPHLKDKHHQEHTIDIKDWKLSSSITIQYHGKIFKLPRDLVKQWPDMMKMAVSMKKRYGMLFRYHANDLHYFAFFDSIEKCRIFSTTNHMTLDQIEALCTELWCVTNEFSVIRYAKSFEVGLAFVLETKKKYQDVHGTKRYLQALSSKQAQNWFSSINDVLSDSSNKSVITESTDDMFDEDLCANDNNLLEEQKSDFDPHLLEDDSLD